VRCKVVEVDKDVRWRGSTRYRRERRIEMPVKEKEERLRMLDRS
jgi:hypothetical protein